MKAIYFLIALLFISTYAFAGSSTMGIAGSSIGVGSIIAIVASWSRNQSVLWAILHAFLGWIYVIYFVLTRE